MRLFPRASQRRSQNMHVVPSPSVREEIADHRLKLAERKVGHLRDPAAADHNFSVVENGSLSWRNGALRLIEGDEDLVVI